MKLASNLHQRKERICVQRGHLTRAASDDQQPAGKSPVKAHCQPGSAGRVGDIEVLFTARELAAGQMS